MKSPARKVLLATSILIIIALFLFVKNIQAKENILILENDLKEFIAPPVLHRGKVYSIKKGSITTENSLSNKEKLTILKIAKYSIENRINPLFALEGTDPVTLEKSIQAFELPPKVEDFTIWFSKKEREQIIKGLYPIEFLKLLPELESMRKNILEKPDNKNIKKYNSILRNTIQIYEKNIRTYIEILEELDKNQTIKYWNGTSKPSVFIKTLEKTIVEAQIKNDERERRFSCMKGLNKKCNLLSSNLRTKLKIPATTKKDIDLSQNIPFPIERNKKVAEDLIAVKLGYQKSKEEIVILNTSLCQISSDPFFFKTFLHKSPLVEKTFFTSVLLLNDFYFNETQQNSTTLYQQKLEAAEISLQWQNPNNLYLCADAGSDLTKILTLLKIKETLKNFPIFQNIKKVTSPQYKKLKSLEEKIVTEKYLFEGDIENYTYLFQALLHSLGETRLALDIGIEEVLSGEKLVAMWGQKSSNFDHALANASNLNTYINTLVRQRSLPYENLLLGRAYPFLFFLLHNDSFVEEEKTFLEKAERLELDNFGVRKYNNDIAYSHTLEEIINATKKDILFQTDLLSDEVRGILNN